MAVIIQTDEWYVEDATIDYDCRRLCSGCGEEYLLFAYTIENEASEQLVVCKDCAEHFTDEDVFLDELQTLMDDRFDKRIDHWDQMKWQPLTFYPHLSKKAYSARQAGHRFILYKNHGYKWFLKIQKRMQRAGYKYTGKYWKNISEKIPVDTSIKGSVFAYDYITNLKIEELAEVFTQENTWI